MEVEWMKETESGASFKATGSVGSPGGSPSQAVQMRLEVGYFNLSDKNPQLAELDDRIKEHNRLRWELLSVGNKDVDVVVRSSASHT